jgi:glycosyltransferase involved in cell wall biosynthesis
LSAATFLFRSGRRARIDAAGPSEFLYGYAELARGGAPVRIIEEGELGLERSWPRALEAVANRIAAIVGVHARVLLAAFQHRRMLTAGGTLVATTHTIGLALAALHKLGGGMPEIIVMTMGLVPPGSSPWRLRWLRWVLAGTTLAALSKPEAAWLRGALGPGVRVIDFAFGVDLGFWRPDGGERSDTVISVGNDWNRDFATLVAAWRPEFPPLEIVTSLPVASDKPNVRIARGDWRSQALSDEALRAKVQRARLVIVPLHDTLQPSGQSAALQAMACGRPVVMSANRGCWDSEMLRRHAACRFVPPGDAQALGEAIVALLADAPAAEAMGARARRMLESEDVSTQAMAAQFRRIIPALGEKHEGRAQLPAA